MTREEAEAKMQEHVQEIAKLSMDILNAENTVAALVSIEIVNVAGSIRVSHEISTTPPNMMEKIEEVAKQLAAKLGIPLPEGFGRPQGNSSSEKKESAADVVEDLLRKMKKNSGNN